MIGTKRKFDEEESNNDSLERELEEMKGTEEWLKMDKVERRRFRNMLIARRTRLRFKTDMSNLKAKVEEFTAERTKLLQQIHTTLTAPLSVEKLVGQSVHPPKIVEDVMKTICNHDDIHHTPFYVLSAVVPNCPIVYATDAFLRLSGYSRTEVIGKAGLFLCSDFDSHKRVQAEKELASGKDFRSSLVNFRKDGQIFRNEMNFTNLFDQKGRSFLIIVKCQEEPIMNEMIMNNHGTSIPSCLRPPQVDVNTKNPEKLSDEDSMDYRTPTNLESNFIPPMAMKTQNTAVDPIFSPFTEINRIMEMLPNYSSADEVDVLNCPSFDFMSSTVF